MRTTPILVSTIAEAVLIPALTRAADLTAVVQALAVAQALEVAVATTSS